MILLPLRLNPMLLREFRDITTQFEAAEIEDVIFEANLDTKKHLIVWRKMTITNSREKLLLDKKSKYLKK